MIGQLVTVPGGRGRAEPGRLYGLSVLRAEADPTGFWGERYLRRAGKGLRRGGALRVLVPGDFDLWPALAPLGLRPVEVDAFVRNQSATLALELLERRDVPPDRAVVALRGARADRDMARTAAALCQEVRSLVVDAPRGGEELANWLRREFGIPVLPPGGGLSRRSVLSPGLPPERGGGPGAVRPPAPAGGAGPQRAPAGGGGPGESASAVRPVGGGKAGA